MDFFGDAFNYAISLAVLVSALHVRWRPCSRRLAWRRSGCSCSRVWPGPCGAGVPPEPITMGAVTVAALAANVGVAVLLYRHRGGDANARSVWICSRNDAIGNVAVGLAALGVFGTGTAWPDLLVAALMAVLALTGSASVLLQARVELQARSAATSKHHASGKVGP